jgi:hypothetical protein
MAIKGDPNGDIPILRVTVSGNDVSPNDLSQWAQENAVGEDVVVHLEPGSITAEDVIVAFEDAAESVRVEVEVEGEASD